MKLDKTGGGFLLVWVVTPVDWRFTTEDARIKLKRLYPSINS